MRFAVFLLLILTQACACSSPDKIVLDERWRPLERLERSSELEDGVYWTLVPVVHTKDMCDFLRRSIVDQNGILVHERIHAVRQLATPNGPQQYLYFYATDPVFRLGEERLAWDAQIAYVIQHGGTVDASYVATFMSTRYLANDGKTPLWSYDEALRWVNSVVTKAKGGH